MAVDKHGRLYWDPAYLEQAADEEFATTVLHEVLHLYLRHHSRLLEAWKTRSGPAVPSWPRNWRSTPTWQSRAWGFPKAGSCHADSRPRQGTPFQEAGAQRNTTIFCLDALQPDPAAAPAENEDANADGQGDVSGEAAKATRTRC